jgi:hypothetical protein
VLFAEKSLVVGGLQIAFDPNFFPLTDKSSDNPRFKFLPALLGRGSDALDTATDNAGLDDDVEVDLQDSSSEPNPSSDAHDAVSSDDDDASKSFLSELLQLSPVPVFCCAPPASSTLLDHLASDEVQDAPLRRGVRSRKEPSRINTRSVLKSATSDFVSSPSCHHQVSYCQQVASCRSEAQALLPHSSQLRHQGQHV